jgi:hypothetical protein
MPTVTNPTLALAPAAGANVTITVTYDAFFTAFDRALVAFGTTYHAHVEVFGMDPAGSLTGAVVAAFPPIPLAVTAGAGNQIIPRTDTMTVPRVVLQEDAAVGDDDEIRCKIRIHTVGPLVPPPPFTPDLFTPELTLIS